MIVISLCNLGLIKIACNVCMYTCGVERIKFHVNFGVVAFFVIVPTFCVYIIL
jgi:hypothetical protein